MTNIAPAIERFRRDTDAPAVLAATIDRDGGFEVEAVGIRRRDEPSTVVSIDDQVHIGSCGKAMTSALYARLVEVGPVVIGKGNVIGAEHKYPDNPALLTPAGRYHLTLHDWARFITVILRNGDGFLTSDSIERLTTMPTSGSDGFAMGWADAQHSGGSIAMQGSNTLWSATVFIDGHMTIASLVAVNDGRRRILENSAHLAHGLVFGTAPT